MCACSYTVCSFVSMWFKAAWQMLIQNFSYFSLSHNINSYFVFSVLIQFVDALLLSQKKQSSSLNQEGTDLKREH